VLNRYLIHPDFKYFENNLINIKDIFHNSNDTIHKARNELKIVDIDNTKYVIKSFKKPNLLNKIIYTYFKSSKAKRSYLNAIKLQQLSINTPKPVAFIEFYKNGMLENSYYVSIYQPYDFTIREVIDHKVKDYKNILKEFAIFSANLHKKGVWHEDYSLGNILIKNEANQYSFSLVDINRMKFTTIPAKVGITNLNKLWIQHEEDMKILAYTYAKYRDFNKDEALNILKNAQNKVKRFKENKKRLKKLFKKDVK